MTTAPPNPTATQPPHCPHCSRETEEERLARYSAGLKLLSEIGLTFARGLDREAAARAAEAEASAAPAAHDEAAAGAPSAVPAEARIAAEPDRASDVELSRAFERVARTVRLSYMLEEKLIADFAARAKDAAKDAAEQAVEAERQRRNTTRRTVDRVVKEAIHAEAGDKSERDHLLGRLKLRLDQNDIYWDLAKKPAEILIARLFRDLGLDPDWDRWQGEDWLNGDDYKAAEEISAAPVCPICGCPPRRFPVPAAEPRAPDAEPESPGTETGSDPP
jgi:hypothetical protein